MPRVSQSCCTTAPCLRVGFRPVRSATSVDRFEPGWRCEIFTPHSNTAFMPGSTATAFRLMPSLILFEKKGRAYIAGGLKALPPEAAQRIALQLNSIDQIEEKIATIELRIYDQLQASPEMELLRTLPGLGPILAPMVWLEIGDVDRFPRRSSGQICRARAAHHRQRRPHPPRRDLSQREPLSQVGIRRGRQLRHPHQGLLPEP
jgi:hypothetical protein